MFCLSQNVSGQSNDKIVQVSGLVMNTDSTQTLYGVHIFDLKRGRGTISDYKGWFSKPFYAGDAVFFSAVGYKDRTILIPDDVGDTYTIVISLEDDITQLADVEVNPFPTEELFKEAFLAMNLNDEQQSVLDAFSRDNVQQMVTEMPLGGSPNANFRYMMNQQYNQQMYRAGPTANPLLNPFAWANFLNSLKKKDN